ncbi:hypothetical protein H5410_055708 [Solanum commersonii]|uniref:Uncharacterized protein n=1 Tax=Solanum commersonii TaxID=4109 RepID=A0A9J5WL09_SOLCO|nr:hypothetical protein H5410_055708 [Solanum commersonii]
MTRGRSEAKTRSRVCSVFTTFLKGPLASHALKIQPNTNLLPSSSPLHLLRLKVLHSHCLQQASTTSNYSENQQQQQKYQTNSANKNNQTPLFLRPPVTTKTPNSIKFKINSELRQDCEQSESHANIFYFNGKSRRCRKKEKVRKIKRRDEVKLWGWRQL